MSLAVMGAPHIRVRTPSSDPSFPVYVSLFSSLAILSQGSRTHYTSNTGAWFAMSCANYAGQRLSSLMILAGQTVLLQHSINF